MSLQKVFRVAVCAGLIALLIACAGLFPAQLVAGQETSPAVLHGAAAIDQLKRDGQYDFLQAANPLTIGPVFSLQQKLLAESGARHYEFGGSVALSGDTLVVGANGYDLYGNQRHGFVYVFTRSGGVWTQQQQLTAGDGAANDYFGYSVAISGDTLVVGAISGDIGANSRHGLVYVFTRNGAVWTERQKLIAGDGAAGDNFGTSVALSGDTLAVGARFDDINGNWGQGSAYIFTRIGEVWSQQQKLTAGDGAGGDEFGSSVALSGDTLVVGAPHDHIESFDNVGSAYIFTRIGAAWSQQRKLTSSVSKTPIFGHMVAISGATVAVSAGGWYPLYGETEIIPDTVYVFTRKGTVWTEQARLTNSNYPVGSFFGNAIAISSDTIIVGAYDNWNGGISDEGVAYVFTRNGAIWSLLQKLMPGDGAAFDDFGKSVAISDDTIIVGSPGDEIAGQYSRGSVYFFSRPPCPTLTLEPLTLPDGFSGLPYQQSVTAGGGAGTYQFTRTGGSLPPGISLSSSGLLSGTTTAPPAIYQFWITATDLSTGCSVSRSTTITIRSCLTVTIDPPIPPTGIKGSPYNEPLMATGGVEPYVFSKKSGLFPPGLSMSANGVISGTPTQTGNFSFTLLITDATGCATTWPASIAIKRPGIE